MASTLTTDVLIAGGGPCGLMLANELGRRNIRCLLVDTKPGTAFNPQANATQARTMEHFRRLGFAQEIAAWVCRPITQLTLRTSPALRAPSWHAYACPPQRLHRKRLKTCRDLGVRQSCHTAFHKNTLKSAFTVTHNNSPVSRCVTAGNSKNSKT